jgi:DNA-binding NtrC family response regulator
VDKERLPYRRFTTGALNLLRNHGWPGNNRELKNLVQRLLILSPGEEVTEADVAAALGAHKPMVSAQTSPAGTNTGAVFPPALFDLPLRDAREHFEKAYLEHHLKLAGGNVGDIAETVGMERTHLYRKLKGLGIRIKGAKEN